MATKLKPIQQALIAFGITLLITCSLSIVQLFWFGGNLLGGEVAPLVWCKLITLLLCSNITSQLPTSIMVAALFYTKTAFTQEDTKRLLNKSFLQATGIAAACFLWTAYIAPITQLYSRAYLFSIEKENVAGINESIDIEYFKGYPSTSNYIEIGETLDKIDRGEMPGIHPWLFVKARAGMQAFPILICVIFYAGFFMGIVFNKNHVVIPVLIIFLLIKPFLFFITTPLNLHFLKKGNPWWYELIVISIYGMIALLNFALARRKLAAIEMNKPQL
jgi:hypothetical protein